MADEATLTEAEQREERIREITERPTRVPAWVNLEDAMSIEDRRRITDVVKKLYEVAAVAVPVLREAAVVYEEVQPDVGDLDGLAEVVNEHTGFRELMDLCLLIGGFAETAVDGSVTDTYFENLKKKYEYD